MSSKKSLSFYTFFITRLAVLIVLLLTISNINSIFGERKVLGVSVDTTTIQEQKAYYQNIIDENPTYVDGYLELSKISAFLGDRASQREYLEKAYLISPNNEEVKLLLAQVR